MKRRDSMYTQYVSAIDRLIHNFDKRHPELSLAQKREREKYKRIFFLRDHASATPQSVVDAFFNKD